MRHGHGLLALVLNFLLLLTPVALAERPSSLQNSHTVGPSSGSISSSAFSSASSSQSSSHSVSSSVTSSSSSSSSQSTSHSYPSTSQPVDSTPSTASSASTEAPATNSTTATTTTPGLPNIPSVPTTLTEASLQVSPSESSVHAVLAASHSNHQVPIIAGVVAPVCLLTLAAVGVMLCKRRRRARDRREWERTHESIADAVRQVASPIPRSITPYAGSGAWNHLASAKSSGDTVGTADPFADRSVMHQDYSQSQAFPVFRAVHSPTLRAGHSPALSQAYSPPEDASSESRPASTTESVQFAPYHDSGRSHAI
ncbi:hypothetical protein DFH08DRAFT_890420 [Mycena albidolilacea]|uniref:Uncharacterized protein n=1 Tax=Mycena albidolilacea TaxID=1033008 RepID=A0AAD6ZFC5_9AGAR|nr:hypothetical protein DFH08DRAFT_890420 [Mycena albidolilacea]